MRSWDRFGRDGYRNLGCKFFLGQRGGGFILDIWLSLHRGRPSIFGGRFDLWLVIPSRGLYSCWVLPTVTG